MSQKFFQSAVALRGPQYQSFAARALGIARSSTARYDNGERDIPQELIDKVYGLLVKRQGQVGKLIGRLAAARKVSS